MTYKKLYKQYVTHMKIHDYTTKQNDVHDFTTIGVIKNISPAANKQQ